MYGILSLVASFDAYVPFPEPGGPKKTSFIQSFFLFLNPPDLSRAASHLVIPLAFGTAKIENIAAFCCKNLSRAFFNVAFAE
jgi:hypothetical protein